MNSIIENTLYNLTSHRNFEEISEDQISKIANDYPYFAPSQLLYSLKLKKEFNYRTPSQINRTSIFFNNPEWFSYHLQGEESNAFEIPHFDTINVKEEPVAVEHIAEPIEEKTSDNQHFQHIDIPSLEAVQGIMTGGAIAAIAVEEAKAPSEFKNEFEPTVTEHHSETAVAEVQTVADTIHSVDEYDEAFTDEQENEEGSEESDANFQMSIPQSISNQLADAKAGLHKNLSGDALEINYNNEPHHAVDYFDSQGIKLDLSKMPQDKLTRQLLKFTDWLKHVKTANPNPKDLGTEPELETKVESSAQHSNDLREIYTETMAEVYAKQGKLEKAIQIYIKLSFLNPDKTAFFAKKIQDLKGI